MPNTPAAIGAGVTGWAALQELSAADRATIQVLGLWRGLQLALVSGTPVDALDDAHDAAIEALFPA